MTHLIAELPPILTTRRVLALADCSRSTLERSGLKPIGKRGGTRTWSTEAVLAWMQGEPAAKAG
jgi:hypothetical protein